jgi:TrfA protein
MADPKPQPEIADPALARALENFRATFEASEQAKSQQPDKPPPPAKVYQLPLWPEVSPGAPNPVLRSALFPAIQSKDRRLLDNELIASVKGHEIRFTGKELNQEDLEVWLEVLDIAKNHPLGNLCHSSAHGLLKALDRATGNHDHQQLDASLSRLVQPVKIIGRTFQYTGGLLMEVFKDEVTRQYRIRVNPRMAALFTQGWTRLDRATRRRLRRKPLALWLHAHYATHKDPYPYTVEKLRELSGSRTKDLYAFRQNLRQALADLQLTGAIAGWEIDSPGDLVRVFKVPTITQRRGWSRTPTKLQK